MLGQIKNEIRMERKLVIPPRNALPYDTIELPYHAWSHMVMTWYHMVVQWSHMVVHVTTIMVVTIRYSPTRPLLEYGSDKMV